MFSEARLNYPIFDHKKTQLMLIWPSGVEDLFGQVVGNLFIQTLVKGMFPIRPFGILPNEMTPSHDVSY